MRDNTSLASTLTVPTSNGCPLRWPDDFFDDRVILLAARLVDHIVLVFANARLVGGNNDDAEL